MYLLNHLSDVPQRGKEYGLYDSLHYLIVDDTAYPYLKEAVMAVEPSVQQQVCQSIDQLKTWVDDIGLERIKELKAVMSRR